MSEIEVTQADRDCEEKIIKAMVSSSFLPGCFAAAHRQTAMIEGARRMQELAARRLKGPLAITTNNMAPPIELADSYYSAILALDPASIVETDQ